MNFNQREQYTVFRALLYRRCVLGGADKLMSKLVREHPEWQQFVDKKHAEDKRQAEFAKHVRELED